VRLFFDLNVILDVLAKREPWFRDSAAALSLVTDGKAEGFIAAHSVTTLDYLLRRHVGADRAAATIVELHSIVRAVAVDHELLHSARGFWSRPARRTVPSAHPAPVNARLPRR
jgi:hypothetical protein